MEFQSTKGIFQQIADNISHRILEGKLPPGERVPSVRDLASEFEVNRNTLLRTYSILEESGIIINKRGIGFFVAENAPEMILAAEKSFFFENELPGLMQKAKILKLTNADLIDLLNLLNENENK
ncbi:MAG TPA: GntR family transcriptional regulator [Paludibacter sp.]|nr:GntR family transcriptional regulator [Paludibacter sp.]